LFIYKIITKIPGVGGAAVVVVVVVCGM